MEEEAVEIAKIKKPLSPFFLFKLANMKSYGQESGVKSCFTAAKGLAEIWKNMTDA